MKKVKTRRYNWKELCEKADGPEQPILAYNFPRRKLYENPNRPYGLKK